MRSAATKPAASPIPPAHTRGTPRSPSSSTSCSALFGPACPPARRFTAISPRTPESSPFSAHFRSVTSWYTRPPNGATRSTTQRSEEHTSELQSPCNLVCRLLLEKKKKQHNNFQITCTTQVHPPTDTAEVTQTRPA